VFELRPPPPKKPKEPLPESVVVAE
jgi:hypothetical protein